MKTQILRGESGRLFFLYSVQSAIFSLLGHQVRDSDLARLVLGQETPGGRWTTCILPVTSHFTVTITLKLFN